MIGTEQTVLIDTPLARVWDFAQDIRGWAKLMPGLQHCDIIDANTSRWTLKIGAGALVRTVKVHVTVHRWAGPEEADFTYTLEGDPVQGAGSYRARAQGAHQTEVGFAVRVEGTGPAAPMWEALGRPLLPKFARGFADEFKREAEQLAGMATAPRAPRGWLARLAAWLRRHFSRTHRAAQGRETGL
jgi:carbon monoxide dehydrogenase subunit G